MTATDSLPGKNSINSAQRVNKVREIERESAVVSFCMPCVFVSSFILNSLSFLPQLRVCTEWR